MTDEEQIGGDLLFVGGQLRNDGEVGGDAVIRVGQYGAGGTVAGSEDVVLREDGRATALGRVGAVARRYVSLLLVATLVLWIARRPVRSGAEQVHRRPLPSLGAGVGGVVAAVLAFIVLMLSV